MKTKNLGAVAAALLIGTSFLVAPAANAATQPTALAQDSAGMVIAQDQTSMLQATPSAPRAVTVTTEPGTLVTINAKGVKRQSKVTNKDGQATFTKLKAGKEYTVTTNDDTTTVTPLIKVGRTSDLTITTTDQVGTIDATWAHKATKARGGADIYYTLTATQISFESGNKAVDSAEAITIEVDAKQAELSGLDPQALYSFSVAAHNALGAGKPSVARMSRSLAAITGLTGNGAASPAAQEDDEDNGQGRSRENDPANNPAPTPAPQPAPKPGPAPKPSTRTIMVCPDGYGDVGGTCTQTRGYTYHSETQTQPYTYTSETRTEQCSGPNCPGSVYKDFGTDWTGGSCPNGGTLHDGKCMGWTGSSKQVTVQVKDNPPSGWSDNGSEYTRTVEVKDAAPAGWSDNGSEWFRTAAKVEKVVPA